MFQLKVFYATEQGAYSHHSLPLALVKPDGSIAWRAEYDECGNVLREDNPENLAQLMRLPGQQYDEETVLYYNQHQYYDPRLERYITLNSIRLRSRWNRHRPSGANQSWRRAPTCE